MHVKEVRQRVGINYKRNHRPTTIAKRQEIANNLKRKTVILTVMMFSRRGSSSYMGVCVVGTAIRLSSAVLGGGQMLYPMI